MKKLITIIILGICLNAFSQQDNNYTPFVFKSVIKDTVEIQGHFITYLKGSEKVNITCTIDGVKIEYLNKEYEFLRCYRDKCRIIHLKPKQYISNYVLTGNPNFTLLSH